MTNPLAPLLDKKYENAPLAEVIHCSTSALEGISPKGAEMLKKVLGVETIADLAVCHFVLKAQALTTLADAAEDR